MLTTDNCYKGVNAIYVDMYNPITNFRLDGCSSALSKEIQLEFTRTMNRILFDKTVTSQPGAFPFVTLPEPHVEVIPETGK